MVSYCVLFMPKTYVMVPLNSRIPIFMDYSKIRFSWIGKSVDHLCIVSTYLCGDKYSLKS